MDAGRCADSLCKGKGKWVGRRAGGHEQTWMRRRVRTVGCKGTVGKRSGEGPMGMSERG